MRRAAKASRVQSGRVTFGGTLSYFPSCWSSGDSETRRLVHALRDQPRRFEGRLTHLTEEEIEAFEGALTRRRVWPS
jgi:hypothetical protein